MATEHKNVAGLTLRCAASVKCIPHVETIIFCIHWVKENIVLTLIFMFFLTFVMYPLETENDYMAHIIFLLDDAALGPLPGRITRTVLPTANHHLNHVIITPYKA